MIDTYLDGSLESALNVEHAAKSGKLRSEEVALLALLKRVARRRKVGERPESKAA